MDRRELIKHIALLTGAAVAGSEFFLSGCKSVDKPQAGFFTKEDVEFFDEVAETILPRTDTPGAKDAEVGKFMALYSMDCYDRFQSGILKEGIKKLDSASLKKNKMLFMDATDEERKDLLIEIDAEAKRYSEEREKAKKKEPAPHYFTLMKQMILLGFFTSKPGATQVLRYNPVPGKYFGCIDYKEGETSWA